MNSNILNFKTNVQLKSIIGKDLINDENIAILELVKNSFDANARRVDIIFQNLKLNDDQHIDTFSEKTSRLIIKDDGVGMDFEDIQNKWLNIAYSEKKSNKRQNNRMMAGAKGVGRFSCDKLGEYLNLYAKKIDSNKYILLKIDWKQFEIEDDKKEIQSINLEFELISKEELMKKNISFFEHGVILEIIKLRSKWAHEIKDNKGKFLRWNTDKFVNLKKYLEKLINPNQAFEENDFGIYLNASEFIEENKRKGKHEKFIDKIENTIFDKLDFQCTSIESIIIDEGKNILTELKDKGKTIFWIKEKNEFFPLIKNAKISLYYLNPYAKAFFTKQTGIRSVDYGSIFLFVNGFRIPPYGEVGNDWLGIDQRKAQGYARYIGLREFVGRIEILDNYNDFQIISSREGIAKNENYLSLANQEGNKSYFFKTLRRLERYVVEGLNWDSIPEDDLKKINEIEKKIISGETKEQDLVYREDSLTKKRRVYGAIHSIISAKAENVIELYINEDLILDKLNEEKLNAEREFEQILNDFENKKIDGNFLYKILQRKSIEDKDLETQINELSKYKTSEATSKAIVELQLYKKTIEKQTIIIEDLKDKLEKEIFEKEKHQKTIQILNIEKQEAENIAKLEKENRIIAEIQAEKIREEKDKEINIEKLKTEFYKKQTSSDTHALIHHVKNNNFEIKSVVSNIISELNNLKLDNKALIHTILEQLYKIIQYNDKSLKATDLILKSDLEKSDSQRINLPSFLHGYVKEGNFDIHIHYSSSVNRFIIIASKLELALILDNLIDNSKKWNSHNIWINFKIEENIALLNFIDDGDGLIDKFQNNPEEIFKFQISASKNGTGFGLYLVRESLKKMNADINIDFPINNKGMNFIIRFK